MDESVFQLEMVSVRLVKETPLLSDKPLSSPEAVVEFIGEKLSQMDREVVEPRNLRFYSAAPKAA